MSAARLIYILGILQQETTPNSLQQTVKRVHVVGNREHIRQDFAL